MWSMKLFMRLSLLLLSNGSTTLGYEIKQLWQNFAYHGKIADFGDYDRNGQLDALSYHSRGRVTSIYVHTVPDETNTTKLLATVDVQGNVDGIIGVDVNLDGALDILVVVKERTNKYRMLILYQDIITGKLTAGWNSTTEPNLHNTGAEKGYNHMRRSYEYTSIHPIVLDINGDGFADFLCQTVDKRLFAWVSSENTLIPYLLENIPLCTFDGPLHGYIPSPHSSAFVDIDGDCRSDLVLLIQDGQNRYLQIWQSHVDNNQTKYVSDESMNIQLPKNHGQVSFVDINGDGTIDIAVPYCTKVDSSGRCIEGSNVAMSLNRQKPFCSYIWNNPNSDMCRKATELCSRSKFTFKPLHETAPISISLPKGLRFHWIENCPLTLSFGDLNNNGFPDLILLAYDVIKAKPLVMVYKNVDTDKPADIYTRSFEQSGNIDILDVYYDDLRVTAVDLFEDGITEIAVFGSPGSNQTDSIGKFYTVVNESIGLFMKAMIKATSNDATPSVNVLSTGSNVNDTLLSFLDIIFRSWVGISDRLKDFGNCTVNNNVDKVCNAILHTDNMPVRVSSKSNPGKQIMPPFCDFGVLTSNCQPMFWGHDSYKNIGSHLVNTAGPTSPRIRGTSCGISGSIRPDDHNKRFYAGDVVPARPN
ncbi:T-cell immunomodulatory protein [Babesia ovis]|uniref:T-cell immunomodulatory protein n=1 Tax=Babesia ovis TaxID=5869 RepID=A0A9W5TC66_BABOV|nr:T-cell immunomodulatory protein [Babesia ovis]